MKNDHVILGDPANPKADELNKTSTMTCLHCREKLCIKLPLKLSTWGRLADAFIAEHAGCERPEKVGGA